MDINQLEVLVTVAREKSFSRAAEALNRTQPAVSQAIRRLEEDVGEKLFDRSSKDGTLTFAGEVLLEHAEAMLALPEEEYDWFEVYGALSFSSSRETLPQRVGR